MDRDELLALADRVEALTGLSNEVDVLVECAFNDCRPNYARSKVIYVNKGREETYLARDWTFNRERREETAAALRALAHQSTAAQAGEGE